MSNMKSRSIKKDIAIIGMSGKFPNSENLKIFWDNLSEGNDLIRFYADSELEDLGMKPEVFLNEHFVKCSLRITEPENFDHAFFGYTKEEAALMDPQIRLLHEQTWLALENAAYNPLTYSKKIGCFLSATDNMNWRTHAVLSRTPNVSSFLVDQISDRASISRLISYALNLKGPSYFLDTACSSSLVGVHVACRSLLLSECTIAVAGGVSIGSSTNVGYMHEEGMIFSKDGYCKAFDKDATGTIMGEGAGIVVLKRLEEAIEDNDHIYGVIRASAVNNDGNQKVGYTAPSVSGQYNCMKLAQKIAGVTPEEISYIEAHGTGTKLGDPIEIEALNKAFENNSSHNCAIGSVKTNIGHLDAAAGVAGLIKTTLSLYHKQLPASLHFDEPNPEIDFKSGPFQVNTSLRNWESITPRIAGVSSFGIGGTNAHAILEEAPLQGTGSNAKLFQLIPFSAKTQTSLKQYREKLNSFLNETPEVNLADLAYTLKVGREKHRYKSFIVAGDVDDAIRALQKISFPNPPKSRSKNDVVFMFSGQGSQYYQIGKNIYDQYPFFRNLMDDGFHILEELTGANYKEVIGYEDGNSVSADRINETCYTQPLLFLLEYAFAQFLIELGIKPVQMIGHSLGEYVAACISEVFSFREGLQLILKRAELMNHVEKGGMLNVQLSAVETLKLLPEKVAIAAINTADSCVVSGNFERIEEVERTLSKKEIPFIKLKTSHAFHSEMMDAVLDAFETELKRVVLNEPKIPFISCLTGKSITTEEAKSAKYWTSHLRQTVLFSDGIKTLISERHTNFVEIGASKTLLSFLRQNELFTPDFIATSVTRHPKETKDDSYYLLHTLGTLWANGSDINWEQYYFQETRNRISAPTYVFDKIKLPARVNPIQKLMELNALNGGDFNWSVQANAQEVSSDGEENSMNDEESVERPDVTATYLKPNTETEEQLCEMCKSLFGYNEIGIDDDFFELGGDSIKAMTFLKRIHKTFNIEIDMSVFFERSNIKELAEEIDLATEIKELKKEDDMPSKSNQLRF